MEREGRRAGWMARGVETARHAEDDFALVLALITLTYVTLILVPEGPPLRAAFIGLQGATTLFALRASGVRPRVVRAAAAALAAALVALGAGTLLGLDALALPGLAEALAGALLLAAPVAVLRRIAHHSRVEAGTVLGAVCVYMLIGLVFAFVFTTMGRAGAPLFAGRADEYSDYLYFSFVTLTTTGYGDLAPLTKSGQALAVLEALIGQVFLVTFVARLVSLYGSERSRGGVR